MKRDGRLGVIPVLLHHSSVAAISTIQMNLPAHNLTSPESLKQVELLYSEILKRFGTNGDKLPLLDPLEDMEIEDTRLTDLLKARAKITEELSKIDDKFSEA